MDTPKPDNCPFERFPVPPELIQEALSIPVEELIADIVEMERTGGLTFEQLISVFDEAPAGNDRPS